MKMSNTGMNISGGVLDVACPSSSVFAGALSMVLSFLLAEPSFAGGPPKTPASVNGIFVAQQQAATAAAIAAAQNRAINGLSVIHGNNGVTFIRIKDPTISPSSALHSFKSEGKIYAIDRNGVIYGGQRQVNTRSLTAAAMGATSNSQTQSEMEKRAKPVRKEAPSVITAEVVKLGE
jgi:filamentous hemagglutinin family protein